MIRQSTKIYFVFNFIICLPKIGSRFLNLLFKRKKLGCIKLWPSNHYCIEGTLNQLIWEVENAVFITLSTSPKVFFNSGELIFPVNKAQTQFQLTAYGAYQTQKNRTQIRVTVLDKNDLTNTITKSKNIAVDFNTIVQQPHISSLHIDNHIISFQKSLMPRELKKIQLNFNHLEFLNNCSIELFNTSSIEEVNKLREVIEKKMT